MASERPAQNGTNRCAAQCRICGETKAFLCNFNGFGIRRRRHERRCAARALRVQQDTPHSSAFLTTSGDSTCHRDSEGTRSSEARPLGDEVDRKTSIVSAASSTSLAAGATGAALTTAAVVLEAPVIASYLIVATVVLCWRLQQRSCLSSRRSRIRDDCQSSCITVEEEAKGAVVQPTPSTSSTALNSSPELSKIMELLQRFHVRDAICFAQDNNLLSSDTSRKQPMQVEWLKQMAPAASRGMEGLSVPPTPVNGAAWTGPLQSSGANWQMSFWYSWSGPSTLLTVSKLVVPGTVSQAVSIFREADYAGNWLPFVTGCSASWSSEVPGLMTMIKAKIPILPKHLKTLIHRAFVDAMDELGGVLIVEWTPSEEELSSGYHCGMDVPRDTQSASELRVDLATTLVTPEGDGRCSIIMTGKNEFSVSRRLVPDFLLRPFLSVNSKGLAQRICSCMEDLRGKGYLERIQSDPQGFYRTLEARMAESSRPPAHH